MRIDGGKIKFRIWITSEKGDWFGCDNYDTFDWNNRMRDVSFMCFPQHSPSGKDISPAEIECEGEDNYGNGWIASIECHLMQFCDLENWGGKSFDWWEGDILHMNERFEDEFHASVIVKKDGCFVAQFYSDGKPYLDKDGEELYAPIDAWMKDSRVKVGNIYSNPNLLTDKQ